MMIFFILALYAVSVHINAQTELPYEISREESTQEIDSYVQKIHQAQLISDQAAAFRLSLEAHQRFPQDPRFLETLGELYLDEQFLEEASQIYKKLIDIKPEPNYYNTLAEIEIHQNDYDEAQKILLETQQYYPENTMLRGSLAWLYYKKRDYQKGIDLILATQTELNSYEHSLLGILYTALLDYPQALEAYKNATMNKNASPQQQAIAYYNQAVLEERFFHFDKAEKALLESLKLSKRPISVLFSAQRLLSQAHYQEALKRLEEVQSSQLDGLVRYTKALLFYKQYILDEALLEVLEAKKRPLLWTSRFGISTQSYTRQLDYLLHLIYQALAYRQLFIEKPHWTQFPQAGWNFLHYWIKSARALQNYHHSLWKNPLSNLFEQENRLTITSSQRAQSVLHKERQVWIKELNKRISSESLPYKEAFDALLNDDTEKALRALDQFPLALRDEEIVLLAEVLRRKPTVALFEKLFDLHPPALLLEGYSLPSRIHQNIPQEERHLLEGLLRSSLWNLNTQAQSYWELKKEASFYTITLYRRTGQILYTQRLPREQWPHELNKAFWEIHGTTLKDKK